ncbi:farnesyl pyrophosphate synthetase 1 [Metarhizium album ARSEF 1941]|uniref:Farnesyl pyrophosphate synthetase 1 n=1 Tax=Metarhizium album (strain ARSEF 1941) TaxID=1081103 RepID=A0A0B2WD73_METAS|nr:farnesyl pyrophosphate synthetase 1 [Metarhizium album ARSEF 1941]KHN93751.1 farnesyl pyrophosphate synthetase 1 [Metarhizium album ARSEF 1941]
MDALRDELLAGFASLNATVAQYLASQGLDEATVNHFSQCFSANVGAGKLHRGLATLYAGKQLAQKPVSVDQSRQLTLLAWLAEMLGAHYLILDDIMDGSTTRRGELCWYRQPQVGLMAINDACLLKSIIFFLLKTSFRHHPAYANMVDLFVDTGLHTELGQLRDLAAAREPDAEKFTMDQYWAIVRDKSSYSISGPLTLALEYWQLATPKNLRQTRAFSVALGEYFQVNDDYVDVFGDYAVTGKHGTDIQDNKCTWFIVEALARADQEQRRRLLEGYGRKDASRSDEVRRVFAELELPQAFGAYEGEQRAKIEGIIAAVDEDDGLRRDVLQAFFDGFRRGRQF